MEIKRPRHKILNQTTTRVAKVMMEIATGILIACHPEWSPRVRSNDEIRRLGPIFNGDILNLSGWKDNDKEGGCYRQYFPNARSYTISNYGSEVGASGTTEKELDLSIPYDGGIGTYDLVFNHTVLEHVYPTKIVFDNLSLLSRDAILTVVPFVQEMHGVCGSFADYFRYSPLAIERLFAERGFHTVYVSWNEDYPFMNVYVIHLASKMPERYYGVVPPRKKIQIGDAGPGTLISKFLWPPQKNRSLWRKVGDFIGYAVRYR